MVVPLRFAKPWSFKNLKSSTKFEEATLMLKILAGSAPVIYDECLHHLNNQPWALSLLWNH